MSLSNLLIPSSTHLVQLAFTSIFLVPRQSTCYSLFAPRSSRSTIIFAVYMDDIMITWDDLKDISHLKAWLHT